MIGKAIRLARQFHGKTLTSVASDLGMAKSYLSEIESGRKVPTLQFLEDFSKYLNIPLSHLLFFAESCNQSRSEKVRTTIAGKVINMLEWISDGKDSRKEAQKI